MVIDIDQNFLALYSLDMKRLHLGHVSHDIQTATNGSQLRLALLRHLHNDLAPSVPRAQSL
jgi:hypothetical protein